MSVGNRHPNTFSKPPCLFALTAIELIFFPMVNVTNFFKKICGSQLHKTDIGGWLDFIFLNIKIDLIICIDCSSKGGIWKKKFKLSIKFSSYNLLLFCTPLYSLDQSFICHKYKWSMIECMITMNMTLVWMICIDSEPQQPFPWQLSVTMKYSLLSVQIIIENVEERIQNGGILVQYLRIKCEFAKNGLCGFSKE